MLREELLQMNQKLLDSIAAADWDAYQELCDSSLTCFEPEALGQFVEGSEFHHFYFQFGAAKTPNHTTMCSPHVRIMGDVAILSYVRLNQRTGAEGSPAMSGMAETRVWQKAAGKWKHVHFHRSPVR